MNQVNLVPQSVIHANVLSQSIYGPHIKKKLSVKQMMWTMVVALTPVASWAIYVFGLNALLHLLFSIASAAAFELLCLSIRREHWKTIFDGSAVLCGMLLALCLPSASPFAATIIGNAFGIIIIKQVFGGMGYQLFNPALAGYVLLRVAFPEYFHADLYAPMVDHISSATPLTNFQPLESLDPFGTAFNQAYFLGFRNGAMGEIAPIALLLGYVIVLLRKIYHIAMPLLFIIGFLVYILISGKGENEEYIVSQLLSGSVLFVSLFIISDPVTSPLTKLGQWIYAFLAGLLSALIRLEGSQSEGTAFAILTLNLFVPMIDKMIKPKGFD